MDNIQNVLARLEQLENLYLYQKAVLNFKEAAEFLSLSTSYLYKLTHGCKIPHYKPNGKNIYFNREELEQWLFRNRVQTTDELENKAVTYLTTKNRGGANV